MAQKDQLQAKGDSEQGWFGEWIKTILVAVIIAIIFRSFFIQPFSIPTQSMVPTLQVGDYLFVQKWTYGYSRSSFPFRPAIFEGRIWGDAPERGDIAVFKAHHANYIDFIKRVIGLPGDRIQMRNGQLYINDQPVERKRISNFEYWQQRDGAEFPVARYVETLPNGVSYEVLDLTNANASDNTPIFIVPEGHYFMMGDNRDNSADSRYITGLGFVPAEDLVGKAVYRWISVKQGGAFWQVWDWRPERMFESLDKLSDD